RFKLPYEEKVSSRRFFIQDLRKTAPAGLWLSSDDACRHDGLALLEHFYGNSVSFFSFLDRYNEKITIAFTDRCHGSGWLWK
ncbi:MAG: hypothetical protein KGM99_20715, partial [Burkholderiales bacterium]|nr:hypothetical protein [Burkholderiales bacterium]